MSDLLQAMRCFWYNNVPGEFTFGGKGWTRQEIHEYGGPAPEFDHCSLCQAGEWLSRLERKNMFIEHECKIANRCLDVCRRQGNELWTTYHQNFWSSVGCDPDLNAAKCLIVFHPNRKVRLYERFWAPYCDFLFMVFRRLLAQTCQVEVTQSVEDVDWSRYDFVSYQNLADGFLFPKPPIPMVMIMYDVWLKDYQTAMDHFQPEYILTPYPKTVRDNFRFDGKLHFYPLHDSTFFARPNLGEKRLDLILAGSDRGEMYGPRRELDEQVKPLLGKFAIDFSHHHGSLRHRHTGPVEYTDERGRTVRYLNKWSEYFGSSKFVAFASFGDKRYQPLFAKYYEILGSGAIPIVPQIPDLELLGVKPMEHYIPLSAVWGNNKKLSYILRNYKKYYRIAENAVKWHQENEKRLLFDQFESLVQDITNHRYPPRLF